MQTPTQDLETNDLGRLDLQWRGWRIRAGQIHDPFRTSTLGWTPSQVRVLPYPRGCSSTHCVFTFSFLEEISCSSIPDSAFDCGPEGAAAIDIASISIKLPRFPTAAQAACERAAAQQSREIRADAAIGFTLLRQGLERLATTPNPTTRIGMWGLLNNVARPELVQSLATALRDSTDDAFRKEAVTLLAVKFADDPAARDALAAVAASGPDTLMRRVAERAVSRDEPWRDYAVARLSDTSLPSDQRLEAWYWVADAMPLDQDKMRTALADMLTALQQRDGVRILADLLADSQKDVSETGYGIAGQQGQRTMRVIGAVNHPAAPELLISCFEAEPNYLTLGVLATRRDDPRIASMLELIAADQTDQRLSRMAANYLSQPLER